MEINEVIGKRIQAARSRKDWNQSDLARALDKPRQHISQLEQGKQQPRAELLVELANVLGVTTDYLLGRSHEEEPVIPVPRHRRRRAMRVPAEVEQ
jgi:transcriptional regulator with XRE-family HTH domain